MAKSITITKRASASPINLYAASRQWATRPADERFWNLDEMGRFCTEVDRNRKVIESIKIRDLSINDDMKLIGRGGPRSMTTWAFKQMCGKIDMPAHFLSTLPDDMAAGLVRHGLSTRVAEDAEARISMVGDAVEAFTSERYVYIPNHKIIDGLKVLEGLGWRVPPARPCGTSDPRARKATDKDVIKGATKGIGVKVGDLIAPAGLYASTKDMFAFMIHESEGVDDGCGKNYLKRGIFVSNSEVGAGAFKVTCFLYDTICGNHIVWGATDVITARIRHLGKTAPERAFAALEGDLAKWAESDTTKMTTTIRAAKRTILGSSADDVAEKLVLHKRLYVGKSDAIEAYKLAETLDADRVNPQSVWGMVTGFTRLSQRSEHGDRRQYLDDTASRLMQLVDMN